MTTDRTTETTGIGEYAEVNGINLYYETRGGATHDPAARWTRFR